MKSLIVIVTFALLVPQSGAGADSRSLNQSGVEACNRGDYDKAVSLFSDALSQDPDNQIIQKNLSACIRNAAVSLYNKGDSDRALTRLREGMSLLPDNEEIQKEYVAILVNTGIVFLKNREYEKASEAADEALRYNDQDAAVRCLAGDIAYARNDLRMAEEHWNYAYTADPNNSAIEKRLNKINKEKRVDQTYSRTNVYHFDIRFDYTTLGNGMYDIRGFLMEAYEKTGQLFGYFPDHSIAVFLYPESEFRLINNVPNYVAGLYDGKIRIPVNFSRYPMNTLKGILFHEYTHAIIHDISGSYCPVWINEGIAMYSMSTQLQVPTAVLQKAISKKKLLSVSQLDNSGTWRNPAVIDLAYIQSWMIVEYLMSRWSSDHIKQMLIQFKNGVSFTEFLISRMNRTPAQFESEWQEYARKRLGIN